MKKIYVFAVCMLFLLVGVASATDVLQIGGTYTGGIALLENGTTPLSEGGGSVDPSYLNGAPLEYLYCADIFTTVNVPGTYPNTAVNNAGDIYGKPLNNAGQVAWLLSNYGTAGQGAQAYALQAAIWHVIFEGTGTTIAIDPGNSTAQEVNLYNSYLAALGSNTGNVSQFDWITPGTLDSNGQLVQYQGLVGAPSVPLPVPIFLLGSGLIGLVGVRRRFK